MTVYRVLADIVDALRTSHLEHEAIRAEMATKEDLAREVAAIRAEIATKEDLAREVAAIRAEMATKEDLAALERTTKREFARVRDDIRDLGLRFEAFRHDTRVTLDMISELMTRTGRHEKAISNLDRRMSRVERHLRFKPLPDSEGNQ